MIAPRTAKLVAIGYGVKTLLLGVAWLVVPDLPQRAAAAVAHVWAYVASLVS